MDKIKGMRLDIVGDDRCQLFVTYERKRVVTQMLHLLGQAAAVSVPVGIKTDSEEVMEFDGASKDALVMMESYERIVRMQ